MASHGGSGSKNFNGRLLFPRQPHPGPFEAESEPFMMRKRTPPRFQRFKAAISNYFLPSPSDEVPPSPVFLQKSKHLLRVCVSPKGNCVSPRIGDTHKVNVWCPLFPSVHHSPTWERNNSPWWKRCWLPDAEVCSSDSSFAMSSLLWLAQRTLPSSSLREGQGDIRWSVERVWLLCPGHRFLWFERSVVQMCAIIKSDKEQNTES